jgi:hypothetical protein
VYVHIKNVRKFCKLHLAPLEEALAGSVSCMNKRSITNPPADVGPPSEAYLLGRLIHDNLTYLRGLYVIPK